MQVRIYPERTPAASIGVIDELAQLLAGPPQGAKAAVYFREVIRAMRSDRQLYGRPVDENLYKGIRLTPAAGVWERHYDNYALLWTRVKDSSSNRTLEVRVVHVANSGRSKVATDTSIQRHNDAPAWF